MKKRRDPSGVKKDILACARREFVENGYAGARIERIAAETATSKRMLYYYFSDKESLYNAVLLQAYSDIRELELDVDLATLPPVDAFRALFCAIFDHYRKSPDFVRLIMIENIANAEHLRMLDGVQASGDIALNRIDAILKRGQQTGEFLPNISTLTVHWKICAFCCFNITHRSTFSTLFGDNLWLEDNQLQLRNDCADMMVKSLTVEK